MFDKTSHARQHPLYPLPAFGVGASMAFDRAALPRIGGFDVALGAGTPARAGEDTAAIADVMLDGGTFVYWPGAVMWHVHRRTRPEVERQLDGYGSGLTAFYTRAVLRNPRHLVTLARLAPRALRDLRGHDSVRTATMRAGYPAACAAPRAAACWPARFATCAAARSRLGSGRPTRRPGVSAAARAGCLRSPHRDLHNQSLIVNLTKVLSVTRLIAVIGTKRSMGGR